MVSVCVHDSGTDLIDHNWWKHKKGVEPEFGVQG